MKKFIALLVSLMLLLTAAASLAEGEILLGQVDCAAHGDRAFAVITVALQDDVIVAAKIDEFQFMADREDLKAVGVPNSDAAFGQNYPEGQVLGSKRANSDLYSLNMQRAGSTVQIAANFNAIEAYVKGKTVTELEAIVNGYTEETKADFIDAVTGATTADTWGYVRGVLAAAKAAPDQQPDRRTGPQLRGERLCRRREVCDHPFRHPRGDRGGLQHDRCLQDRGRL